MSGHLLQKACFVIIVISSFFRQCAGYKYDVIHWRPVCICLASVIALLTVAAIVIMTAHRGGYLGVLQFSVFQTEYDPLLLYPRTAILITETERFYMKQVSSSAVFSPCFCQSVKIVKLLFRWTEQNYCMLYNYSEYNSLNFR